MAKMFWGGTLSEFFLRYKNLLKKHGGGAGRCHICSGGHPCLPYPAASCRAGHKTEPTS
jgi:hypothetical protein